MQVVSERQVTFLLMAVFKVIIEKSRCEVSPMGQDTIENVS